MKELLKMMECVILDAPSRCSVKQRQKDMKTIRHRVQCEGLSFLTITLPSFSDTFFQCVELGEVSSQSFLGWKKRMRLPAFLQGFTSLVFCPTSGGITHEPQSTYAIQAVRQICNLFKKVSIPCSSDREHRALNSFITTDRDLGPNTSREGGSFALFRNVSNIVVASICGEEIDSSELIPHHGPGSTYERAQYNMKFVLNKLTWYNQLEPWFDKSCVFNTDESYHNSKDDYKDVKPFSSARVITVPKTLKGPRVIAIEPTVIQFTQQSIKDYLVRKIESSPLTSGHINFSDQSINQRLALESSSSRSHATLDMTEASDRVSARHVYHMLSVNPTFRDLCFSTRSHFARVLGQQICLNKFASMGSALCFPIESLYFFVIIMTALLEHNNLPPTYRNIFKMSRRVYVYGDDIIIPTDMTDSVITTLTNFGNVVSLKKSFYKSHFRESCGVDAYKGIDITPTYVRSMLPQKRGEASAIISVVDTANQFFDKQYYRVYDFIQSHMTKLVGNLPQVTETCAGLGWRFVADPLEKVRFNRNLQVSEVRTLVPKVIRKKDKLRDYNALSKCLLKLAFRESSKNNSNTGPQREFDYSHFGTGIRANLVRLASEAGEKEHLEFSPRRGALTLKHRWVMR